MTKTITKLGNSRGIIFDAALIWTSYAEGGRPGHDFTKMIPTNNDPHRGTPTVTGSDRIVAALENEGVERTRHEQPTAFMAPTYGWLTGKPGVCISTLGPGTLDFCFISKVLS